jgi:hypothetical protein
VHHECESFASGYDCFLKKVVGYFQDVIDLSVRKRTGGISTYYTKEAFVVFRVAGFNSRFLRILLRTCKSQSWYFLQINANGLFEPLEFVVELCFFDSFAKLVQPL